MEDPILAQKWWEVPLKPVWVYLPAPENLYAGKVTQLSTALGYAVILYQDKLVYSEAIRSNYSLRNKRRHLVASIWQLKNLSSCGKPIQLNLLVSDHISLPPSGKCLHCCSKRGTAWSWLTGDSVFRDSNEIQHLSAIILKMNTKKVCRYRIAPQQGLEWSHSQE